MIDALMELNQFIDSHNTENFTIHFHDTNGSIHMYNTRDEFTDVSTKGYSELGPIFQSIDQNNETTAIKEIKINGDQLTFEEHSIDQNTGEVRVISTTTEHIANIVRTEDKITIYLRNDPIERQNQCSAGNCLVGASTIYIELLIKN